MPYKDPLQKRTKYNPPITLVCPMCDREHVTLGQTGRKSPVCGECYSLYRRCNLILAGIQYRCKKFNLSYDLDDRWLFEKLRQPCLRTGIEFNLTAKSPTMGDRPFDGPSVDKIDPNGGYVKSNCQVVIWWYNCMKQRYSDQEVLQLCKRVVNSGNISI